MHYQRLGPDRLVIHDEQIHNFFPLLTLLAKPALKLAGRAIKGVASAGAKLFGRGAAAVAEEGLNRYAPAPEQEAMGEELSEEEVGDSLFDIYASDETPEIMLVSDLFADLDDNAFNELAAYIASDFSEQLADFATLADEEVSSDEEYVVDDAAPQIYHFKKLKKLKKGLKSLKKIAGKAAGMLGKLGPLTALIPGGAALTAGAALANKTLNKRRRRVVTQESARAVGEQLANGGSLGGALGSVFGGF